jgi:hypothetical protein
MRRSLIALAFTAALVAGMTASIWNPVTRAYDDMTRSFDSIAGQAVDDAATPDAPEVLTEEDPGWNCLTMGNRLCGAPYRPVDSELADALSEGEEGSDYPWETCLVAVGDTTIVVCPDGKVITS